MVKKKWIWSRLLHPRMDWKVNEVHQCLVAVTFDRISLEFGDIDPPDSWSHRNLAGWSDRIQPPILLFVLRYNPEQVHHLSILHLCRCDRSTFPVHRRWDHYGASQSTRNIVQYLQMQELVSDETKKDSGVLFVPGSTWVPTCTSQMSVEEVVWRLTRFDQRNAVDQPSWPIEQHWSIRIQYKHTQCRCPMTHTGNSRFVRI